MSDEHSQGTWQRHFNGKQDDEPNGYRAFKPCAPGEVTSVDLVPASPERPGYEISYFQSWMTRYFGDTMLAILCPATEVIVFIEGRNLTELRRRLRERRVEAIYEYNPARDGASANDATVVTSIRVEVGNDMAAIHNWQKP